MDDTFKNAVGGAGMCIQLLGCLCACGMLGGVITYFVFLIIYAFNNPDPAECWYAEGLTAGALTETAAITAATAAGTIAPEAINTHVVFVSWFTWGFWTCVAPCMAIPLYCLLGCMRLPGLVPVLGGIVGLGTICSQLFWIIFGSIWRFSAMGQACTRDALPAQAEGVTDEKYQTDSDAFALSHGLQVKSGAFMKTWLIIQYCCIGLSLCCTLLGLVAGKR